MTTIRNQTSTPRMLLACALCLGIAACGGDTGTGNTKTTTRADSKVTNPYPPPQADTGAPTYLDGGAPPPAADSAPASNCPAAAEMLGTYSGTYKGTVTAGLPFSLTGTLTFTLVQGATPDEYTIQNGKLQGAVLGISYSLPMQGKVACGKLDGAGTGDVSGVKLQGTYKATWVPGGFPTGSWAGQDLDKKASGSGTWQAKKQ